MLALEGLIASVSLIHLVKEIAMKGRKIKRKRETVYYQDLKEAKGLKSEWKHQNILKSIQKPYTLYENVFNCFLEFMPNFILIPDNIL